jgi:hypothetical protein
MHSDQLTGTHLNLACDSIGDVSLARLRDLD